MLPSIYECDQKHTHYYDASINVSNTLNVDLSLLLPIFSCEGGVEDPSATIEARVIMQVIYSFKKLHLR